MGSDSVSSDVSNWVHSRSDTTSFVNQEIGTKERSNLYIHDVSISNRKCNNPYYHICLCE